ncbi:hypothetical protein BaRGS_00037112 [Batillaria attramentaria]|uniref:Gustatory receptor n=1 Tax=Batillaria attramentaria TaxID=370345 RepID=A0ABD0J9P7_9CAEN
MKPKITQVAPLDTKPSSSKDKTLDLFWSWELTYRFCGLYFDWPAKTGRRTTLRGGRLLKIGSSVHTVVLMLFSFVNCFRYSPNLLGFKGLTADMALILLFMIVYSSGVWYYICHFWLMSRYSVRLAEGVARVFQLMNTCPKVTNLKTIIVAYCALAVVTCVVSTTPLYLHTFNPPDDSGEEELTSVRLLPASPNTTLYLTVLYVYTYVNVFQYLGFYTLVAYIMFFCYVVGHAFGEVTARLRRLAETFRADEETRAGGMSLKTPKPHSDGNFSLSTTERNVVPTGKVGPSRADVDDLGVANPGRHFLQESAINAMKDLLDNADELDLEILHLHHSSNQDKKVKDDPKTCAVTFRNVKDDPADGCVKPGEVDFTYSNLTRSQSQKADKQKLLRSSHAAAPESDLLNGRSGGTLDSQLEDLRHYHLRLIECVELADSVIGTVVFAVYWEGILMACFSVYALIIGAFPQSEFFTLFICLLAVGVQIMTCTGAGVWLNTKAHEPQTALLQLDVCRLSDKEYRSMHIFLSQVGREHIGITAFGLLPVNRATYLTIVGTIITYAVVVLQFNSGCQTTSPTATTNFTYT